MSVFESMGKNIAELDEKYGYFIVGYLSCLEWLTEREGDDVTISEDAKDRIAFWTTLIKENPREFVERHTPKIRLAIACEHDESIS